ncbi:hypothetical protein MRY82_00300 [bacterium]|nr:hypothetical protein [bacterium]
MRYTVLQKNQVHAVFVINHPKHASKEHLKNNQDSLSYLNIFQNQANFTLHILHEEQALLHGVGQARKIGMDYACQHILPDEPQSYLVSLDADTPLHADYIHQLQQLPAQQAWSSYFEHPTLQLSPREEDYKIRSYELYLRYLAQGLKYAGSAFSYIPIGSAFGLSKELYLKSGGMVEKDATEDFHYLNKLRKISPIAYLPQLKVIPAARKSNRVYLGTGFYLSQNDQAVWLPKLQAFTELKYLLYEVKSFWHTQRLSLQSYLNDKQLEHVKKLEIKLNKQLQNCKSEQSFTKRIPQSFDALEQVRFLKLSSYQENSCLDENFLNHACKLKNIEKNSLKYVLSYYRKLNY